MVAYAEGEPSWVDLASPDVDGARRFYEHLFGWTSTVAPEPEAGGYTLFHKDGAAVAAVGPLLGEAQPTVWSTYFTSPDVEATGRRIEAAGGTMLMAPLDVMRYGRMSIFLDPGGATFALWQPGDRQGADLTRAPGSLAWVELATRETASARAFYPAVFGWTASEARHDGGGYTVWRAGDKSIAGMVPMDSMWSANLPPHWMVYFEVEECDITAGTAEKLGGSVSVPPTDTAAGRFAVLQDRYGASFSIIRSDPEFPV